MPTGNAPFYGVLTFVALDTRGYKLLVLREICVRTKRMIFKACVRYFLSIFHFSPNDRPSKTMKSVFLFHLKSSFRSKNIQIFVFFPILSTLSRFKRKNGSGIIYDVINWKLTFLRLFDNPVTKCLIFKRTFCMQ